MTSAGFLRRVPRGSRRPWSAGYLPSGATSSAQFTPETEQECAELYQTRIFTSQQRQLFPLKEDLADWINRTLEMSYITGDNFLDVLDNGVVLCQLAKVIQRRAMEMVASGQAKGPVPTIRPRCWERAARHSFYARDNMDNFIQFARQLGVHENLLFESEDLVLQSNVRSVILCLLEVSRIVQRFGIDPPGLVQFEKEIALEQEEDLDDESQQCHSDSGFSHSSFMSWQFHPSPTPSSTAQAISATVPSNSPAHRIRHSSSSSAITQTVTNGQSKWNQNDIVGDGLRHRAASDGLTTPARGGAGSDGVPSDNTEDEWSRGSGEDPDTVDGVGDPPTTELDRKVQAAARETLKHCRCTTGKCFKLRVNKVGEGKYSVAGKIVFIRLLKGRHTMVRVGGGWDTLEHYLLRHDPCQVKMAGCESPSPAPSPFPLTPALSLTSTPSRKSTKANTANYLHTPSIQKYSRNSR